MKVVNEDDLIGVSFRSLEKLLVFKILLNFSAVLMVKLWFLGVTTAQFRCCMSHLVDYCLRFSASNSDRFIWSIKEVQFWVTRPFFRSRDLPFLRTVRCWHQHTQLM
jgi:hypothetical protein